ncbi:hypothetical protein [Bradyrhizobium sp. CCBAU 51627]|uniref:hypothetical protein n=1 Tax=Bradyrhizobium sp. CCBAU 51627 TaxID=1325088 RepID=UPI00230571EA|nr:hypothetical protein [Bradyrhizobium sp. CCBAU 51627]MDA9437132.1 hypothetical protein [Bradyrhizobium sp. CCBAU 51627]
MDSFANAVFGVPGTGALQFHFFVFCRIASHDSIVASEVAIQPKKQGTRGSGDLFRAKLNQIIKMKHAPVQLADEVDRAASLIIAFIGGS